jgi:hypothetical protein
LQQASARAYAEKRRAVKNSDTLIQQSANFQAPNSKQSPISKYQIFQKTGLPSVPHGRFKFVQLNIGKLFGISILEFGIWRGFRGDQSTSQRIIS